MAGLYKKGTYVLYFASVSFPLCLMLWKTAQLLFISYVPKAVGKILFTTMLVHLLVYTESPQCNAFLGF